MQIQKLLLLLVLCTTSMAGCGGGTSQKEEVTIPDNAASNFNRTIANHPQKAKSKIN
jgi:hypothetical protein